MTAIAFHLAKVLLVLFVFFKSNCIHLYCWDTARVTTIITWM